MVTALCNIYIGNEQKFGIFKQTFPEVFDVSDNWLVYIRGKYRKEVIKFMKETYKNKPENITFFENLYDENWFKSTKEMLKKANYDYIYLYWEDHFLVNTVEYFKDVINDMGESGTDYLQYSFYDVGLTINSIDIFYPNNFNNLRIIELNSNNFPLIKKKFKSAFFPFSNISVSKKTYFEKILKESDYTTITLNKYIQYGLYIICFGYFGGRTFIYHINKFFKLFGIKLSYFGKNTPFDLEKSPYEFPNKFLPLKIGISKQEIFANWDGGNISLIKRGLYPKNLFVEKNIKVDENKFLNLKEYIVEQGLKSYKENKNVKGGGNQYREGKNEYIYYENFGRSPIYTKYVKVLKGQIEISGLDEKKILKKGEIAILYANIKHTIKGLEDVNKYVYFIEEFLEKPDDFH